MSQIEGETLLIHAPYGRDAELLGQVVQRSGIHSTVCPTVEKLCESIEENTGAALICDESLTPDNVPILAKIINSQPPWSDLPLIVTTSGGEATAASRRRLRTIEPLGNVSLLERPLRIVTLLSTVQMALRARRRQFQLRENFAERERLVKELERSNSELAQFAHIVSHDLQAPIRMVRSFSQLLARSLPENLPPESKQFIQAIQDGAVTMEQLVRSLLHYASLGEEPITRTKVELESVVEEVLTTLQPSLIESGACVCCGTLPVVYADRIQLLQVLQNLVGNALKYARSESKLQITLSAVQSEHESKISVGDNGAGIAPEFHERIFQPLKRLHGKEIAGTGMGLAVCRKIIERHGGKLWVESAIGKGSKFIFTLPFSGPDITSSSK